MNVVLLIGNVATDPVCGESKDGKIYARFRLAINNGKDNAHFFSVVAFNKPAEIVKEWVNKGALIAVRGRLVESQWVADDGSTRKNVEIIADRVQTLSRKNDHHDKSSGNADVSYADIPF